MRIGIDVSRANREQKTGVEWYVFFLIQAMKKLSLPENIEFILYSEYSLKGELAELPTGWSSKVLSWIPHRLWTQFRLSFQMFIDPPDVLFIPSHVFPFIHPKKTVLTLHDIAAWRFPNTYNWFEHWYSLWMSRVAMKQLWRIITPSKYTKQEVLLYTKSVQSEKIQVIPHGVDRAFRPLRTGESVGIILQKYLIQQPYILFIGRIETKKNIICLIKSFEKLKNDFIETKKLHLVLVGKPGFGYTQIGRQIEKSAVKNDIIETGWIPSQDVQALMRSAKIFIFPSMYEGFGMPILEAFASGVPVIAARGTSLGEIGKDAALFVSPDDKDGFAVALHELLVDKQKRIILITKGENRLKEYSWDRSAKETINVLIQ